MTDEAPKLEDICITYNDIKNSKDWDRILSVRESINTWVERRFGVKNIEVLSSFSMLDHKIVFRKQTNGATLEGHLFFNFSDALPFINLKIYVLLGTREIFYFLISGEALKMTDIRINDAFKKRYNHYLNDYEDFILYIREQLVSSIHSNLNLKNMARERTRNFKAVYDTMKNIGII